MPEQSINYAPALFTLLGTIIGAGALLFQSYITGRLNIKLEMTKLTHQKQIEAYTQLIIVCDNFLDSFDPTCRTDHLEVEHSILPSFNPMREQYAYLDRQTVALLEKVLGHLRSFPRMGIPEFDNSASIAFVDHNLFDAVIIIKDRAVKELNRIGV